MGEALVSGAVVIQGGTDGSEEDGGFDGFEEEVGGSEFHAHDGGGDVGMVGDHDDGGVDVALAEDFEELEAGGAGRAKGEDDASRVSIRVGFEQFAGGGMDVEMEVGILEDLAEGGDGVGILINEMDGWYRLHDTNSVNVRGEVAARVRTAGTPSSPCE